MKSSKKVFLVIISILVITLVGCGGSGSKEISKEDETVLVGKRLSKIKNSGKLVLGTSSDYQHYEFKKEIDGEEKVIGSDIEVGKRIAQDLGVEFEVVDMEFDKLIPSLNNEEVDIVIASIISTEERKAQCIMSKPYYDTKMVFLVKADDLDKYYSVDDFEGKIIGYKNISMEKVVYKNQFHDIDSIKMDLSSDLIAALNEDKIQAALMLKAVAEDYANSDKNLAILNLDVNYSRKLIVAMKTGNEDLLKEVNNSIDKMTKEKVVDSFIVESMKQWEDR